MCQSQYFTSTSTFKYFMFLLVSLESTYYRKANGTVCFASSQVWSEHRMETTSWDLCPAALPKEKTSQHPQVTSHTSSTRVRGATRQSRGVIGLRVFKRNPQIQLLNHQDTRSPRDPQRHRQNLSTTRLLKVIIKGSKSSKAITTTAITKTMTTGTARSRGNTSAGEGRNVCKDNFSF